MRLIDIGLLQSKNVKLRQLTVTVRAGSKVNCSEGKFKLTNYID